MRIAIMVGKGAPFPVRRIEGIREDVMRDESTRLEWSNCELCDEEYTWFRVWVMAAVELYGWLHRTEGDCPRDKGLAMSDMRFSAE